MQYSSKKINNTKNKKNNQKFPIALIILLLISAILLVYCAVSVFMFASSFSSANATNESNIVDGDYRTIGNISFTITELFGLTDYSSAGTTILLLVLSTLGFASLATLVVCAVKLIKTGLGKSLKIILLIVAIIAGLILGALATYYGYQLQLDIFKDAKDSSSGAFNSLCVDTKGQYYSIDGNGNPYLALVIDDEPTNDEYVAFGEYVGINDIDALYVQCKYTSKNAENQPLTENDKITITEYYIEGSDGTENVITLSKAKVEGKDVKFDVTADKTTISYKVATNATFERSDIDAVTNILVVGKDRVALNTDVMILISLKENNGKYSANILQIPRDTYCRDNSSNCKINAVYGSFYNAEKSEDKVDKITAGMEGLKSVLERNLTLKIDYWAIMDLDGFSGIVDGIGGVDLYVPFDMHYEDYSAVPPLVIDLKEGQQTLDGKTAEQFIRYRKGYTSGDLGRVDATKVFLTATFVKLRSELSITNPAALTNTVSTLMNYVTTNMDAGNAVSALKKMLKLSLEDITFLSVPGNASNMSITTASYFVSNRDGWYFIVNNYFNVTDNDIDKSSFDSSRMFTATGSDGASKHINGIYTSTFDEKEYVAGLQDAEAIKDDNEGDNKLMNGNKYNG